jgi:hypothetical protein
MVASLPPEREPGCFTFVNEHAAFGLAGQGAIFANRESWIEDFMTARADSCSKKFKSPR